MDHQKRIIVVGTSGCGKSTFSRKLGQQLNLPVIELDQILWKPNWTHPDPQEMVSLIERSITPKEWVVDGNYRSYRFVFWPKATLVIWLDYSFIRIFWRVFKRTLSHIINKTPFCGENYETWQRAFFSTKSIFLWVIKSYFMNKSEYPKLFKLPAYRQLRVIRFRSPKQAEKFLKTLNPETLP